MLTQFSVGQIWTYTTRDCETDSRMTIVRLDEDPDFGTIVHVFVSGVSIPNTQAPGGITTFIAHLPYSEEALEKCVLQLDGESTELPDYEEAYQLWRTAFESDEAGVFDDPVSEVIASMATFAD
ncbi:hypothetical protein N9B31_03660 [Mariniblastus sp.]|nr:hypothetical protein [Mariniblastus sp.]MDA7902734.1 hypothetical protein [Mariniblastus sp.]MDB4372455.1 hypothetical protein [Mariniblastus sp.]MDB4381233.1 hypothetical protein [Mariniblastus sp.]MDC3223471.1 hypothetical protein [Mariniblastus sp.]